MQGDSHVFLGIKRDLHPINQNKQFLWDAHNIRLTTRDGDTMMSITNERSTKTIFNFDQGEVYIGHAVLGKYLVIFTQTTITEPSENIYNTIYRIDVEHPEKFVLYSDKYGDKKLNFNPDYPIQAITDYESELIQKVYWVDGLNSPRVINIKKPVFKYRDDYPSEYNAEADQAEVYNDAPFDFVPELELNETVKIERITNGNGSFPAGVIQYAFTYYNKYGQESNIFYTSELLYTSFSDRGGSPEEVTPNVFKITVDNIQSNFDYLRIYSILRTSIDADPTTKRVADIEIPSDTSSITYLDNNTTGDTVDPTRLLYIESKDIIANNIATKDSVLFLSNIKYKRRNLNNIGALTKYIEHLKTEDQNQVKPIITDHRSIQLNKSVDNNSYIYANQLSKNTSTFKSGEYYRLGLQAQYKTGEWSEPIFIKDYKVRGYNPTINYGKSININLPIIVGNITTEIKDALLKEGYLKIRPLIVFPTNVDRSILAQGILCPTVFNAKNRADNSPFAQSSWFFRTTHRVYPFNSVNCSHYRSISIEPLDKNNEIQNLQINEGQIGLKKVAEAYKNNTIDDYSHLYFVDQSIATFHSPDLEFNDGIQLSIESAEGLTIFGSITFNVGFGSIDIQTSSPPIDSDSSGVVNYNKVINTGSKLLISELCYEDKAVDDIKGGQYEKRGDKRPWLIYPWHRSGSLNNDVARQADTGQRTAVLKKKVLYNFRFSKYQSLLHVSSDVYPTLPISEAKLWNSNEVSMLKFKDEYNINGDIIYYGNVDTVNINNDSFNLVTGTPGKFNRNSTLKYLENINSEVGDYTETLKAPKDPVRIKYKSSPHGVITLPYTEDKYRKPLPNCSMDYVSLEFIYWQSDENKPERKEIKVDSITDEELNDFLWIADLYRGDITNRFGGTSKEALQNNVWLPAGPAVRLDPKNDQQTINWVWGDTWYQRYDCLKTYPFTFEDENQVIEIASFMCETFTNIDGRYDKNRNQTNNFSISPTNYNLINPVYSQKNNFFTYRILDEDYYKINSYPAQFIWTEVKNSSEIQDTWTNLHMASSYDLDSSEGQLISIQSYNDKLISFQESSINQILFNSRIQIQASDGVPIEIANSQKIEGKRVISNNIGCQDSFSIITTPAGIYFIDNQNQHLYLFSDEIKDLSVSLGSLYWARENNSDITWRFKSHEENKKNGVRLYYDPKYQDVYFTPGMDYIGDEYTTRDALCYSEQFGQFTSLMSYGGAVMFPVESKFYSIALNENGIMTLYENFAGDTYNNIFGKVRPFSFSFISNNDAMITKIFDTIEITSDSYNKDGVLLGNEYSTKKQTGQPLDYIRVTNEYQDTGEVAFNAINFRKKFRIWRAIIPRNKGTRERIRNPWAKITLGCKNPDTNFTILHDVTVKYTN